MQQETLRGEFGSYVPGAKAGGGAFGTVYMGFEATRRFPVGIKRLHPNYADDANIVQRFIQEAETARGLTHPNIVQVLDHGRDQQGVPFIVMEWVQGQTIGGWLQLHSRYAPAEAAAVGCQVLDGLSAAWERRVVHRDIKPANLMVTDFPRGLVKIMDFGIAKDMELAAVAGTSGLVGTPAYMSPEQFRGEPLDCRVDLYALAVTLFVMLVGRTPFQGPSQTDYMRQHLQEAPPRLEDLAPEVPPGLAAVLRKALAKSRDERYRTPEEMLEALRPFAGDPTDIPTVVTPERPFQMPPTVTRAATSVTTSDATVASARQNSAARPSDATVTASPSSRDAERRVRPGLPWVKVVVPAIGAIAVLGVGFVILRSALTTTPPRSGAAATVVPTPNPSGALLELSLEEVLAVRSAQVSTITADNNLYSVVCCNRDTGYQLYEPPDQTGLVAIDVPVKVDDAAIAIEATMNNPTASQYLAVACRGQKWPNARPPGVQSGYVLLVYPAQQQVKLVQMREGAEEQQLLSPPVLKSEDVVPNQTNRIGLSCRGSSITALINGKAIANVTATAYPQGGFQFGAGADDKQGVRVSFKNLSVQPPSS